MLELLVTFLIILCIIGVLYWAATSFPLPPPLKIVAQVVVVIVALVLLFGLLGVIPGVHVVHLR